MSEWQHDARGESCAILIFMLARQNVKYALIVGISGILFLPFFISNSMLFPFITGKGFAFRILVEILLGIWLIAMFYDSSLRPRFSRLAGALLIWGGVIVVADVAGVSFYRSFWSNFERMDGLFSLLHLLAYFFVVSSVLNTRARWQLFFNVSVLASVIMSVYAFLQLAGKIVINQGGVRVDGTFGNATYLAVYMLFNFFITLFLLVRAHGTSNIRENVKSGQNQTKWLVSGWYGIAMVFQLIVLYFTATRGAILGLIGGVLMTALIISIFERERPRVRKTAVGMLLVVLALIGGFVAARHTDFVKQSQTLNRFASLSIEEISKQGRRYVWPMAVQGFKEKPILGWGQENFNYVFNKYYDPRMYNQEPWFDRAHNIVLDWLIAGGILGLLSYFGVFAFFIFLTWKSKTLSISEKSVLLGITAAYFFQNLFVFDNLFSYVYFLSLLAFVHSDRVQGKTEPSWLARLTENAPTLRKVAPGAIAIAVMFSVYYFNVKPIQASRAIISALSSAGTPEQSLAHFRRGFGYETFADGETAEQAVSAVYKLSSANANPETKREFVSLALEKMGEQTKKFSGDARYLLFMGNLKNRLGDYADALVYLEQAQQASPKKQKIIHDTGLAHLASGNYEKALEQFKVAYELAPEYDEAIILYAVGAIYTQNIALAKELLAPFGEEEIVSNERIVAAYAGSGNMIEAIRAIERRIQLHPDDPLIRFRLAAGYLELKQRNRSVEILRETQKLFPAYKEQAEYYIREIQAGRNP